MSSPEQALVRVRRLAHLLDDALVIPGLGWRFGLDALIGLFPFAGDLLTAFASLYIVGVGASLGLPRVTLMRMLLNVFFDTVAGSVPVAGDLLDAAFKANLRNVALLEAHMTEPRSARRRDYLLFYGIALLALVCLVGGVTLVVLMIQKLAA